MPPFEVGNALKSGVVDIANVDRRVLHQRDAGSRRLEAHRAADVGAAQERRLRLHGAALCGEDECDLPGAARRQQSVSPLSEQADHQARSHRPQAPHHAGLSRFFPGARRDGRADRARRGLYRAGARRGRRLWLADHRHLRSRLAREDEISGRSRLLHRRSVGPGQQNRLGQADRGADATCCARRREQAEADAVAEFAEENAKDTKRQADAGIQTIKLDGAAGKRIPRQGLRSRLGRRHPAKPAASGRS